MVRFEQETSAVSSVFWLITIEEPAWLEDGDADGDELVRGCLGLGLGVTDGARAEVALADGAGVDLGPVDRAGPDFRPGGGTEADAGTPEEAKLGVFEAGPPAAPFCLAPEFAASKATTSPAAATTAKTAAMGASSRRRRLAWTGSPDPGSGRCTGGNGSGPVGAGTGGGLLGMVEARDAAV
jgi:hypothetical protein